MAAATADAEGVLRTLMLVCNVFEERRLAACLHAYRHPSSAIFGIDTSLLSQIVRFLKSRSLPDRKAEVDQAYMQLITTVSWRLQPSGAHRAQAPNA